MEPNGEKTVSVKQDQLEAILEQNRQLIEDNRQMRESHNSLLARLDEMASGAAGPRVVDEDKKEMIVRVAFINGKAFTGYVNRGSESRPVYVYEKANPLDPNKKDSFVDVMLEDGTVVTGINYIEFLRESDKVNGTVVETIVDPWHIDQGTTPRRIEVGGEFVQTGEVVPVRVKGTKRTFKIKVPGREDLLTLDENAINIG